MKIIVIHQSYGCDTGCCGHVVEIDNERRGQFYFSHPYGKDRQEYVRNLVTKECGEEHVKDIDWENCIVLED